MMVDRIWEAIDRNAVLVFHDQHLDDEGLRDFAGNFGELEIGRAAAEAVKRRLGLQEIGEISNLERKAGYAAAMTDAGIPMLPTCPCRLYWGALRRYRAAGGTLGRRRDRV